MIPAAISKNLAGCRRPEHGERMDEGIAAAAKVRRAALLQPLMRAVFTDGVLCSGEEIISGNPDNSYVLSSAVAPRVELAFFYGQAADSADITTKLRVSLAPGSHMTLIERHFSAAETGAESSPSFVVETSADIGEGAELAHAKIFSGVGAAAVSRVSRTSVKAARGARYESLALLRGEGTTRNETEVTIGEAAECFLGGAMLLRGEDRAGTVAQVLHTAPQGKSRQNYRSVAANRARGFFQGKIVVGENAQKTEAHQLCRALLLSHQAAMEACPELEIYAGDVKCGHGCAIGNLDGEALFYLRSRGVEEPQARAMLIEAFVNECTEGTENREIAAIIGEEIREWLNV